MAQLHSGRDWQGGFTSDRVVMMARSKWRDTAVGEGFMGNLEREDAWVILSVWPRDIQEVIF